MIIVLKREATEQQIQHIVESIREWGLTPNLSRGTERSIIGVIGDERTIRSKPLEVFPGVDSVMSVLKPYKLASAEFHADRTRITLPAVKEGEKPVVIGGSDVVVVAGPCSVETRDMLFEQAAFIKKAGAKILRAGAFKPRTSPYAFQGLGVEGLRYLAEVRAEVGMPIITEVMDTRDVEMVAEVADILQIGARNTQNFNLLRVVGRCNKPVLIKRGISGTIEELLMSAEYVLSEGNSPSHPLRARHPHVRARDAEHAGYQRRAGDPEGEPSADHGGPQPRDGAMGPCRADGEGGGGGRRRRRDGGSASESGGGAFGRRPGVTSQRRSPR